MINLPKGTKDVLPKDSYKWQYIEKIARETAREFAVSEVRTPTFEHTEVFLRGVGETTDIVNKEMYTFLDKGDRSITLKPEGTAGVARAFVENGLYAGTLPAKLFYITPCFRYERPQAGRLREFHQFGVEVLGSNKPSVDAETIILAKRFLEKLGVQNVTLYLNSIGCPECRKKYSEDLKKFLSNSFDELCPLCQERATKNPMRVLDCKNEQCNKLTKNAPCILDYICDDCKQHFDSVQNLLNLAGVQYKINDKIIRGLDYYTKTVFEFVSEDIGVKSTVCGGGRYDKLITEFGGPDLPGIGFAVGLERLILMLENLGIEIPNQNQVKIYIAPMGEKESQKAFELVMKLRRKGIVAETDHMGRGIKSQFKYADKICAEYVGVIGSNELEKGVIKVKNMQDGSEREIEFDNLINEL